MGCSQSTAVDPSAAPRPQRAQAKAKTTKHADAPSKNNKIPAPAAGEEQPPQAVLQRRELNTTIDDENADAVAPEFAAAPPMSIRMERPAVSTVGSLPLQMPSSVRCNVSSFNISFIDPASAPSSRGTESNIDSSSSNYNFLAAAASESKIRTGSNRSVRFEEDTVTAADLVVSSEFDQEEDAAPASAVSTASLDTTEDVTPVADVVSPVEETDSVEKTTGVTASVDSEEAVISQEAVVAPDTIESVQKPVNIAPTTAKTPRSAEDTAETTAAASTVTAANEADITSAAGETDHPVEIVAIDSPKDKQDMVES